MKFFKRIITVFISIVIIFMNSVTPVAQAAWWNDFAYSYSRLGIGQYASEFVFVTAGTALGGFIGGAAGSFVIPGVGTVEGSSVGAAAGAIADSRKKLKSGACPSSTTRKSVGQLPSPLKPSAPFAHVNTGTANSPCIEHGRRKTRKTLSHPAPGNIPVPAVATPSGQPKPSISSVPTAKKSCRPPPKGSPSPGGGFLLFCLFRFGAAPFREEMRERQRLASMPGLVAPCPDYWIPCKAKGVAAQQVLSLTASVSTAFCRAPRRAECPLSLPKKATTDNFQGNELGAPQGGSSQNGNDK